MYLKIVIVYLKVFLFCWYWDQNIVMLFNNSMGLFLDMVRRIEGKYWKIIVISVVLRVENNE